MDSCWKFRRIENDRDGGEYAFEDGNQTRLLSLVDIEMVCTEELSKESFELNRKVLVVVMIVGIKGKYK